MATITKSIGTAARDYSTITLWEAALSGAAGGAGNDAVGECYNDSTFSELFDINDNTPNSITLQAASGEEHDGTADTGVKVNAPAGGYWDFRATSTPIVCTDIELDANDLKASVYCGRSNSGTFKLRRLVVHDEIGNSSGGGTVGVQFNQNSTCDLLNSIIYNIKDIRNSGYNIAFGFSFSNGITGTQNLQNVTIHKITCDNGSAAAHCVFLYDDADITIQNVIATDAGGTTSGTIADYSDDTISNATVDHNIASDTTASGAGSLDSVSSADLYISTAGGSEDLHLKSGADAIGAGTDLGTSPSGVEVDIDGRDRDAEGDTWDIGADQYVAAASALVGSTSITFAASGDLGAVGTLAGSVSLTFAATGDVAAKGALAGNAVLTFAASGSLGAVGSLAGSSSITFAASGNVASTGALAGSTSVTFGVSGNLGSAGALAGSTPLTFTASAVATANGALTGNSSITFTASADLGSAGALAGSTSLTFAASGDVAAAGTLAGSSSLIFAATGNLASPGVLAGSTSLTFAASAAPSGTGLLSGAMELAFAAAADLTGKAALTGDAALMFGAAGSLTGGGALASSLSITFAVTGNLTAGGVVLPVGLLYSGHYSLGV